MHLNRRSHAFSLALRRKNKKLNEAHSWPLCMGQSGAGTWPLPRVSHKNFPIFYLIPKRIFFVSGSGLDPLIRPSPLPLLKKKCFSFFCFVLFFFGLGFCQSNFFFGYGTGLDATQFDEQCCSFFFFFPQA